MLLLWGFLWLLYSPCLMATIHGNRDTLRNEVGFLVDRSGSIGSENVDKIKFFIDAVLSRFSISPSRSRIGLVSFAGKPTVEHNFNATINREFVIHKLKRIKFLGGKTNFASALYKMLKLFHDNARHGSHRVLFLFTDGRFKRNKKLWSIIRKAKYLDIKVFLLGIGKRIYSPGMSYLSYELHARRWTLLRSIKHFQKIINAITRSKGSYVQCRGEGYVRDECDRLCACVDGRMVNCYRVRKEFNEMSYEERVRFTKAFKVLSNTNKYEKRYDSLIRIHATYFCKGIHDNDQFLPWHRWYLWKYENMLRGVDCRITVPYWDWSYWSKDPWSTKEIWRSTPDGLGGNGDKNDTLCVETGQFVRGEWELPHQYNGTKVGSEITSCGKRYKFLENATHWPVCLRRNFHGVPPNSVNILRLLHLPVAKYPGFIGHVISDYHDDMHNNIGGDMCTNYASWDPVFFMHHNFLDKIWYLWQSIDKAHVDVGRLPGLKLLDSHFHADSFLDSHHLPGSVKVTYSSFGQHGFKRESRDLHEMENNPGQSSSANRTDPCQPRSVAAELEQQVHAQAKEVKSFLNQTDFPYNPVLFDHLNQYNLGRSQPWR